MAQRQRRRRPALLRVAAGCAAQDQIVLSLRLFVLPARGSHLELLGVNLDVF